jgi:hypothetical protein
MASCDDPAFARFQRTFRGQLVLPTDAVFAEARRVWNGMVDKRPALIAYCTDAGDAVEALGYARAQRLAVSVRAGGHNAAGLGVSDNGLVIDVSRMKRIEVDPQLRIVRAGAGLTLREFDVACQSHGLATTMGVNSDTGIAGLTLGGGIGKLGRSFGLSCDNLIAAEVVTADGRLLTAGADENEDLLWGLRGGGGNFGIVTTFEYRVQPVGPLLWSGFVTHDYTGARDAMRFYAASPVRRPMSSPSTPRSSPNRPAGGSLPSQSAITVPSTKDGVWSNRSERTVIPSKRASSRSPIFRFSRRTTRPFSAAAGTTGKHTCCKS